MMLKKDRTLKKVLLCGYYGENNLGDDELLRILLNNLPEYVNPWITAGDSMDMFQFSPDSVLVNRRSIFEVFFALIKVDCVILGGGSLLQDQTSFKSLLYYSFLITLALIKRIPVFLWAQGLGPLTNKYSLSILAFIFHRVQKISFRDIHSVNLAKSLLIESTLYQAPDPVWTLPTADWEGAGALVLVWRSDLSLNNNQLVILLEALEQFVQLIDSPIHWLVFDKKNDANLLDFLYEKNFISINIYSRSKVVLAHSAYRAMCEFSSARLVIPMRLHAVILAQLAGSPIVALSNQLKVSLESSRLSIECIDIADLPSSRDICEIWKANLDKPNKVIDLEIIRKQACIHLSDLVKWLDEYFEWQDKP